MGSNSYYQGDIYAPGDSQFSNNEIKNYRPLN